MASVTDRPDGTRRVQFTGLDRRRRTLYLGKVPRRTADTVCGMVRRLNAAALTGDAPDDHAARWVASLGDEMHGKLAAAGLVTSRSSTTLRAFLDAYLDARAADAKPGTLEHLRRAAHDLAGFLGDGRDLRAVTPGDADDYRRHLTGRLGENTVRRRVGRAKQFFAYALRKELVNRNPFEGQKCQVRGNPARAFFLTREDADRLLEACPDAQWRLIVALARFGGLRCPSELVPLTWDAVDWDRDRLTVASPKTAHHDGGASRRLPLFPELRPHLEAAHRERAKGDPHVVTRCRDSRTNLRTGLQRIVKRAGLKPWPKLFHNLRASRQTELAASFPMHVVCEWIGNSAAVASEHYLTVTDADFGRAAAGEYPDNREPAGNARGNARATQIATPRAAAGSGKKRQPPEKTLAGKAEMPPPAASRRPLPTHQTPRVGLEPTT